MKTIIILLSLLLIICGIGCVALSPYLVPTEVDRGAVSYAVEADVAEPNDYIGYPNLIKAERLNKDVDAAHNVIQLDLGQQIASDNLVYAIHKETVSSNLIVGREREQLLFGEQGLLSLGLSMMGAGGLAGFFGLRAKRKGDYSPPEFENAVAAIKDEISLKQKQLAQVVKGVQDFMSVSPETQDKLKSIMNKTQDTQTRETVAQIKVTL